MNEQKFTSELNAELLKHSDDVITRIRKVLSILPEETKSVSIVIAPNQDGDGIFDIFVSLDGPDLYVLNKKIRDNYQIFSPVHTAEGIEPYIPDLDPFDVDFEVNDTVADIVMAWLKLIWKSAKVSDVTIPIYINVEEGFGSIPSLKLQ